jgi:hypothetical protein
MPHLLYSARKSHGTQWQGWLRGDMKAADKRKISAPAKNQTPVSPDCPHQP